MKKMKKNSRVMDEPEIDQKSSQIARKSGGQEKSLSYMEEDVSSIDDMPNDYMKFRFQKWTLLQLLIAYLVWKHTVPNPRNKNSYDPEWRKWEVMILFVICGRSVSGWAIQIIEFFMERSVVLRKRVLYFVYSLKQAIQNCIWLGLILIAWQHIFVKNGKRGTHRVKVMQYVTRILICLLVGTNIWLLKTLIVKVLASNFYVSKYFDRIQKSLFNQYVISKLSGPPKQEQKLTPKKHENEINIEHLQRMNQKNISAWNMNRIMNAVSTAMLTTSDENLKHIKSENQAKLAAKKIFCNVAKPDSNHIDLEDLRPFLCIDQALNTIRLFDGASRTKGISKQALENWVVNVFRERRALALSFEDIKSAVDKVNKMLDVVVWIIIIMIWFLINEAPVTSYLILLILVLASFLSGDGIFTGLKFLFIMHPFDVGDRCEINGNQMIVEEIYILKSVFLGNGKLKIEYPNSVLSTMSIANYRRSPDMVEAIDFCVKPSTSPEKVDEMKKLITRYVENNSGHWQPDPEIIVTGSVDSNRNMLKRSLRVSHHMNFPDMLERMKRRTLLVEEMLKIFTDLKIEYSMLHTEINDDNLPASASERVPSNWRVCAN